MDVRTADVTLLFYPGLGLTLGLTRVRAEAEFTSKVDTYRPIGECMYTLPPDDQKVSDIIIKVLRSRTVIGNMRFHCQ